MHFTNEDNTQRAFHVHLPEIPAGLTLRRATAEDYDGVMKISEGVLDVTDYLPSLYHQYLAHPTRYMFLAEIDKHIVCIDHKNIKLIHKLVTFKSTSRFRVGGRGWRWHHKFPSFPRFVVFRLLVSILSKLKYGNCWVIEKKVMQWN